ncbi:MAG: hypothetical protein M0017_08595 [Desulfobacteraceae bacterium]|nr:hypothetical protein [Desulfobacteraceae bacterium]
MRIIPAFVLTGLLTLSAASGCAPVKKEPPAPQINEPPIRTLVILPTTPQIEQNGSPATIKELHTGAEVLDGLYAEYFAGSEDVSLLTEERLEALSGDLTAGRLERAREVGKKLGSDAVLLTGIGTYAERVGTNYAASSPASVGFRFQLLRVDNGRVACVGQFAETQQPLSENILAFHKAASRSFKWLTARELARDGLQQELKDCEPLQQLRHAAP